eukprot:GHVT01084532.1.p1 GENE.GHVT01084532.1~~GHVT01084532.1.p1  ORF type:complete len:111 (-),score=7.52 GHVT01084532.1:2140-2472(-)
MWTSTRATSSFANTTIEKNKKSQMHHCSSLRTWVDSGRLGSLYSNVASGKRRERSGRVGAFSFLAYDRIAHLAISIPCTALPSHGSFNECAEAVAPFFVEQLHGSLIVFL